MSTLILSCNSSHSDNSINSSADFSIKKIEKLPSPYSTNTLYRFMIEGSMAFTSNTVAINILSSNEGIKKIKNDYYTFENSGYPFFIKWINGDTLLIKCLIQGVGLKEKQPFKKEIVNWKNWTFNIEYYSMYSSGLGGEYKIDSILNVSNSIIFYSMDREWGFDKNDIQISLDTNKINLLYFKIDTFNEKIGLSQALYKFYSDCDNVNLDNCQILIEQY